MLTQRLAKGPLSGDSTVRNADSRLKGVFSSSIEGAPDNLKSLTEFGITTTRQGSLEINYDMLDRQLNNNFDKLGEFFGGNNGFAKKSKMRFKVSQVSQARFVQEKRA